MATLKELLENKAQARAVCDEVLAKPVPDGENMSQEDQLRFDKAAADVDKYDGMIARQIKIDHMEQREAAIAAQLEKRNSGGRPPTDVFPGQGDNNEYRQVFQQVVLRGFRSLDSNQQEVFHKRNAALMQERGVETQQTGNDALGGFSVPTLYDTQLIKVMKSFSGIMDAANIFNTSTGANILMPKSDQTAQKGAIIGETETDIVQDFNLGQVSIGAKIFTSRVIKVSKQLLTDSFLNFQSEVIDAAAERIARYAEEVFTKGGAGVTGLIPSLTTGHTSALTDQVSYDDLIDLQHSVNSAYRKQGAYMFTDNTFKDLRKMKDGEGRPLWQSSLVAGAPDMFAGKKFYINDEMADLASGAKGIAFGDFNKFRIRMVNDRELVILREKYALERALGFNIFQRMDAVLTDSNAIKVMENA